MHKTSAYVQTVVAIHNLRDKAKEAADSLREQSLRERIQNGWNKARRAAETSAKDFFAHPDTEPCEHIPDKYGYVFRHKSRWELVLLSGTVCGIEFCYAAETAYVTPILLSLGLSIKFVTMIWCLSPLIGFFLTPICGSLSDSCESRFGRRRPFIMLLSLGILLGLILVPNGHHIGIALGDKSNLSPTAMPASEFDGSRSLIGTTDINGTYYANSKQPMLQKQGFVYNDDYNGDTTKHYFDIRNIQNPDNSFNLSLHSNIVQKDERKDSPKFALESPLNLHSRFKRYAAEKIGGMASYLVPKNTSGGHLQPWSIAFTVIGTVLLDFCSDACQSPSRTYLLDVSLPSDHAAGLSTFTLMAGLGGSIGYLMGAVHWEATFLGHFLGGQVNVVFLIVTIVFIICLIATVCSFPEIPLSVLRDPKMAREYQEKLQIGQYQDCEKEAIALQVKQPDYGSTSGTVATNDISKVTFPKETFPNGNLVEIPESIPPNLPEETESISPYKDSLEDIPSISEQPTVKEYLRSIIRMPGSLRILCLTNLFCWMSLVCYSLYFTDFVGECVYGGDPQAPEDSESHKLYKDGVRFGCWGMALYSLSCSVYSYFIEALVKKLGAKPVYIGGQLVYSMGMVIMAAARHPAAVILLSPTAGVMYSTLFTMPYLLISRYHCTRKFREDTKGGDCGIRGIGTDVATVSSMVFLSQFILSLTMGSIVEAVGSNVATVCAAAILSACGSLCATQVMYLDI